MNTEDLEERYSRQRDIVPADRLAVCKATVIGVGAVGRQVSIQLTAMGIPWLQLVDFDIVEPRVTHLHIHIDGFARMRIAGGQAKRVIADRR